MNLSFGLEVIYEGADFHIDTHDRADIVGVNGAGKTTLFHVSMHEQKLDNGTVSTGHLRIGYLPQEITLEDESCAILEYLQNRQPIQKLENELNQIYQQLESADSSERTQLFKQTEKLRSRLESLDYCEVDSTFPHIADRMQIDIDLLGIPLGNLSSGQKSQIAFVRILYVKSGILLLDEPTDYLDAAAKEFVIGSPENYKGMVLIISRDINFLNQIINKILFINKTIHKVPIYDGSYDIYKQKYTQEQRSREQAVVQEEKETLELGEFVRRTDRTNRTNHTLKCMRQERAFHLEKKRRAKQTRDRIYKRIRMGIHLLRERAAILPKAGYLSFRYPNQSPLCRNLSSQINGKERFLVVGENDVEKSMPLKLIVGIFSPDAGDIHLRPKADVAYYTQELEQLDLQRTVLGDAWMDGHSVKQLHSVLSNFFFYADDIHKRAEVLSLDERTRIAPCRVLLQRVNFSIFDEPTNHLDPETQSIVGGNLHLSEGMIMAVGHNP